MPVNINHPDTCFQVIELQYWSSIQRIISATINVI